MIFRHAYLTFAFIFFSLLAFPQTFKGYEENFNDNGSDWPVGDKDDHGSRIENGKYVLIHKEEKGAYVFYKEVFMEPYKDFSIEVKMTQISGIDNNGYGIVFGMADTKNSYNFVISSNGMYSLYGFYKDEYKSYKEWTDSKHIKPLGEANILGITRKGEYLHLTSAVHSDRNHK
jgi:hypothetical protein